MRQIRVVDKHLEELILLLLMTLMVTITFAQVIMRYVFGLPLVWSEELVRYSFIWLVYIGISYAVKKEKHIKVEVLTVLFKSKKQIVIHIISNIIFLILALFVVIYGFELTIKLLNFSQKSPSLQIPMAYIYLAGPVGMGLTTIRLIQNSIVNIKKYRSTS